MTGVTAVAAGGLVQIRQDLADTEQMAGYGRQLNEAGYAVIADLVCTGLILMRAVSPWIRPSRLKITGAPSLPAVPARALVRVK